MEKAKYLVSSPCPFTGEYNSESCVVKHAWDFDRQSYIEDAIDAQHFFVVEVTYNSSLNDNDLYKKYIRDNGLYYCILLSVLYGKIFYTHGAFEFGNLYYVPQIEYIRHNQKKMLPFNSNHRKDIAIDLKLENVGIINKLLSLALTEEQASAFQGFYAAAKQYYYGLYYINKDPDIAYVSFVESGEILANSICKSSDDLLDPEILEILYEIESLSDGEKKANIIRTRLFQLKRRYTKVLMSFLDNSFFDNSPSKHTIYALNEGIIYGLIKGSYDLRSHYVHMGESFGTATVMMSNWGHEFNNGFIDGMSKDLMKKLESSLSMTGIERIIRYSLYKRMAAIISNDDLTTAST